jgi:hypothetical protein
VVPGIIGEGLVFVIVLYPNCMKFNAKNESGSLKAVIPLPDFA